MSRAARALGRTWRAQYFSTKRRQDIDNFNNLWGMLATKLVWEEDSQIVELTLGKGHDKSAPHIELSIEPL
jgi:Holliday junction resolvase RusA-like endonuclease